MANNRAKKDRQRAASSRVQAEESSKIDESVEIAPESVQTSVTPTVSGETDLKSIRKKARANEKQSKAVLAGAKAQRKLALVALWEQHLKAGTTPGLAERWKVSKTESWRSKLWWGVSAISWFVFAAVAWTIADVFAMVLFPIIGGSITHLTGALEIGDLSYLISAYIMPMLFITILCALVIFFVLFLLSRAVWRMLGDYRRDLALKPLRIL